LCGITAQNTDPYRSPRIRNSRTDLVSFSIPGYHFHFLSDDRRHGGHLLECSTAPLRLRREELRNFHLALPENESFLKADLSKNAADELAYAEQAH
jgi:acetolactate decarboxylase